MAHVGVLGFELRTSCSQSRRANQLRYTPIHSPLRKCDAKVLLFFESTNFSFKKSANLQGSSFFAATNGRWTRIFCVFFTNCDRKLVNLYVCNGMWQFFCHSRCKKSKKRTNKQLYIIYHSRLCTELRNVVNFALKMWAKW